MSRTHLRILYVGDISEGGTSLQRMLTFRELGHDVTAISSLRFSAGLTGLCDTFMRVVFNHVYDRPLDRKVLSVVREQDFDLVWIDKGLSIAPSTFREIRAIRPAAKIAGYSGDDMMRRNNHSRHFLKSLPLYDMYVTTKSFGVSELRQLGCPKVVFINNSYDQHLHRPVAVSEQDRQALGGPVGFIGTAEHDRAWSVARLAEEMPVKVWGDLWDKWQKKTGGRFVVAGPSQYGETYVRIICAFDINLCFLRKCNRDRQTTRSVEIPACGAFMLAERTDEHLALFEEGREAEFFGSDEEMIDKAKYYLEHPDQRQRIAAAGRRRCVTSGYTYLEQLRYCLERVYEP